ncbi:MAG: hypothetical protein GY740_09605 [Gammaproteobacteria bacterium]|nr:hypothetical protein [Gammaproteobacteria bacterium]
MRRYGFLDILKSQDAFNELSILKRNSKYMLVSTRCLRFVDVLSYSPLKCSLQKFYDAFLGANDDQDDDDQDNEQGKGQFPYCYVRSVAQLDDSVDSIKYRHFNDVLQSGNALDKPHSDYRRLMHLGHDEKTALKMLGGLKRRPLPGREVMARLRLQWRRKGYETVKDLMEAYLVRDIAPLYLSIVRFMAAFETLGLGDMLHSYISLSQASYRFFMDSCESSRHFCGLTGELYTSMRSYLCGGPSVAYERYLRCGETLCRQEELSPEEAEVVTSIYTLDVTSHYANCMSICPMPIGLYQLRRAEDNFKGQFVNGRIHESLLWISWMRASRLKHVTKVRTLLNEGEVTLELTSDGRRVRFDATWKDGDSEDERLSAAEFLECNGVNGKLASHGLCPECSSELTRLGKSESLTSIRLREKTMSRLQAIASDGNVRRVIYEWQCKWLRDKATDRRIGDHCSRFQPWQGCSDSYTDRDSLLEDILDGKITGLVLCTISVAQRRRSEMDFFPCLFSRRKCSPLGPLREHLIREGIPLPKAEAKLCPSHSQRNWHHTSTIQYYHQLLGADFLLYNISAVFQSRVERCFTNSIDHLQKLRTRHTEAGKSVLATAVKGGGGGGGGG